MVEVRPIEGQIDDLVSEVNKEVGKGNKILIFSIFVCSAIVTLIRGIGGEDVRDIIFVFFGSVGVFQLYMCLATKKYKKYFFVGIIMVLAALLALVKWFIMR